MSFINTAYAAGATTGATGAPHTPSMAPMFIVLSVIVVFYVFLWRKQGQKAKTHQSLLSGLTKGDEVVTTGGITGKVSRVDEQFIGLKVDTNTEISIQKPAISTILPKGTIKHID